MAYTNKQENNYIRLDYPAEGYIYDKIKCCFAKIDKEQLKLAKEYGVVSNYMNHLKWEPDTKILKGE